MNCGYYAAATLAVASVLAVGCGGVSDDDAMRLLGASSGPGQVPARAPVTVSATAPHLYFEVTNHLHVAGDVVARLDLNAGAVVEMEAATVDSSPLKFEIWEMHEGGWTELIDAFDTQSGFSLTSFTAPSDNTFAFHFPAPAQAEDVSIHLDCERESGRCTADLQPGERCFEESACSPGLACAPNDGACNPIWAGGACVLPGDDTACDGLSAAPVCGCDGVTYANECLAFASGKGMKTAAACSAAAPPG